MKATKFATQVDASVLQSLRSHARAEGKSISLLVTEALREYLQRVRVRPAFRSAMNEVLDDHAELLKRLAE